MLNFEQSPEFAKDIKVLTKRWRSIPNDLQNAKRAITPLYVPIPDVDIKELRDSFFATKRAAIVVSGEDFEVVKMRFDCTALGNDKKTRLVFVAFVKSNTVTFVEMYAKNDKEREDPKRYKKYLN